MDVYEPMAADGYEWINACENADYETLLQFDGTPRAGSWKPIKVRRVSADERQPSTPSDFPWLGSDTLIMRRTAIDALRDILEANGEILPLLTDDGTELFVFNSRALNALDEPRSSVVRIPGTNRIMYIERVAFIASVVNNSDVFRLPHRASPTYVSDRFVRRVNVAGLRGLEFHKVWAG